MKIKKFSSFVAENAADYIAKKDSDKEATEYEPRSQGEKEFKGKHGKPETKEHPTADADVHTGATGQTKPEGTGKGEKTAVAGGTSVKEPKGGGDSSRPADKKDGEKKPQTVKEEVELEENKNLLKDYKAMKDQGKKDSAILDVLMSMPKYKRMSKDDMRKTIGDALRKGMFKEEVELSEGVMDDLRNIVKTKGAKKVKFDNGKSVTIDMQTANALVQMHGKLKDANKKKMEDKIGKSPEVLMKLLDVAMGGKK